MDFQTLPLVLLLILPLCSAQRTYYVTPTPDVPCPTAGACCVFSNCVDQVYPYFHSNTTLVFLPGNYTLETSLSVRGVHNLTLTGDPATFPQITSTITCNNNPAVYLAFSDVRELHISSLAIDSCLGSATHDFLALRAVSLDSAYDSQIINCVFLNSYSTATELTAGTLIVQNSGDVTVTDCVFENNVNTNTGALVIENSNSVMVTDCIFQNNTRGSYVILSSVSFTGNHFVSNVAVQGGGLFMISNNATLTGNDFIGNRASIVGGGLDFVWSNVTFRGETTFLNNTAVGFGGGLFMQLSTVEVLGNVTFERNSAEILGGAILIYDRTNVRVTGSVRLVSNNATYGAAIAAIQSNLITTGCMDFQDNEGIFGAGIYLRESGLTLIGNTTLYRNMADSGGAIYASTSNLYFEGSSNFVQNSAVNGGGLLLTSGSIMHLFPNTSLHFINNQARGTGGAIEVEDSTTLAYCISPNITQLLIPSELCFFQFQMIQSLSEVTTVLSFVNNVAVMGGSDLYGGTVNNCRLPNISCMVNLNCSSGEVFDRAVAVESQGISSVSSDPLRLCMCSDNVPDCSNSSIAVQVFPGQALQVSATALGQRNGGTAAVIRVELLRNNIEFRQLEYTQRTNRTCTNLHYTILSLTQVDEDIGDEMTLSAEGLCLSEGRSLVFDVKVLPCPPGFQQLDQVCMCNERLNDFITTCNIDSQTLLRPHGAEFWVGYDSDSQDLILNSQCPFDYCTLDQVLVSENDSDTQCNYVRGGVLCGRCSGNTSLVLGSSRCRQCSNSYLALIIAFAVAGIALVFLLLVLKLTVAVGTINGLILYANIVQVNSSIFYPPGSTNILTVFIAWINLDLGIETCFYNGMDAYAKTWLQFVFPIYVWILVGLITVISHFSQRMTHLLGSNPIAVLATLFLLSYAKILRTIIAALSVSYLRYPGSVSVAVWSLDGNIEYLTGKHIPFFLIALLALLLLFLPYTLFLFLAQWVQTLQGKLEWRIFSWLSKPSVRAFLDACHAPYSNKHRYWTGLLLLIRCILFLIFASVGDDSANLLVISSVMAGTITLAFVMSAVYKKWYLGVLEVSFLLNMVVLAAATYHVTLSGGSQAAVTFTSLVIAFTTFAGIVIFHIFLQLRSTNCFQKMQLAVNKEQISSQDNKETSTVRENVLVSMSSVYLREPVLDES